jgi:hypothetical protein
LEHLGCAECFFCGRFKGWSCSKSDFRFVSFWESFSLLFRHLMPSFCFIQSNALVGDWMQGLLLSILVVGVFLAVSALRDYLVRIDMNHQDAIADLHQVPLAAAAAPPLPQVSQA